MPDPGESAEPRRAQGECAQDECAQGTPDGVGSAGPRGGPEAVPGGLAEDPAGAGPRGAPFEEDGAGSGEGLCWSYELDLAGLLAAIGRVQVGDPADQEASLAEELEAAEAGDSEPRDLTGVIADQLPAGPGLAGWLANARPDDLTDWDLPGVAAAYRRVASWAQAGELAAVAVIASRSAAKDKRAGIGEGGRPAHITSSAVNEVSLALAMSQVGASWWADLAVAMRWRLPATGAALAAGTIDLPRARLIAEATAPLDDEDARAVEDLVLPAAGGQTTGQLRAALRRAVLRVDPRGAEERRQNAERRAKVSLYPDEVGTAALVASNLPGVHATAAMARISAMARAMKAAGSGGGIDLLRAQVFIGLLLGTLPLIPADPDGPPDSPSDPDAPPGDGGPGPGDSAGRGSGSASPSPGAPGPASGGAGPASGGAGPASGGSDPGGPAGPWPSPGGQAGPLGRGSSSPGSVDARQAQRRPPGLAGDEPPRDAPGQPSRPSRSRQRLGGKPPRTDDLGSPGGDSTDIGTRAPRPGSPDPPLPGNSDSPRPGSPDSPRPGSPDPPLPGNSDPSRPGSPGSSSSGSGSSGSGSSPPGSGSCGCGPPGVSEGGADLHGTGPPGARPGDDSLGDHGRSASGWPDCVHPDDDVPPVTDADAPDRDDGYGDGPSDAEYRWDDPDDDDGGVLAAWPPLPATVAEVPPVLGGAPRPYPDGASLPAGAPGDRGGGTRRPPPGLLDLTISWRVLTGHPAAAARLGRLGPVSTAEALPLACLAVSDPAAQWRVVLTDPGGRAIAVERVRRGQLADNPGRPAGVTGRVTVTVPAAILSDDQPGQPSPGGETDWPAGSGGTGRGIRAAVLRAARRAAARAEKAAAADAAAGGCAHTTATGAYRPPTRIREYVVARDQTCRQPYCGQPAWRADLDHTTPWHKGGLTCPCNIGGGCRTHHQIKQQPGWTLHQPTPGTFQWTTPGGRTYTTQPDIYPT